MLSSDELALIDQTDVNECVQGRLHEKYVTYENPDISEKRTYPSSAPVFLQIYI